MEADECLQQMDINLETIIYDSVLDDDLIKEELVVDETEVIAEEEIDYSDDRDVNFDDTNCDVNRDLNDCDDNCSNNLDGQNEISSKSKFNGLGKTDDSIEINDSQADTNFRNQSNEEKLERDNCNVKSWEDNLIESKGKDSTFIPAKDPWSYFTGLKVKQFTPQELEAFKKPFEMGWRREVVLRGTVTNSGKKIGDVYYFSPDKKVKLRSYIEMGSYLKKHPDCNLEPENFTFARQPIYKYPEEIVRHAMQRNQPADNKPNSGPVKQQSQTSQSTSNVTIKSATASDSSTSDEIKSVAEGRAKRKRVAPTRFEDEDYSEQSPFKKKPKIEKSSQEGIASSKQLQVKAINSNLGPSKSSLLSHSTVLSKKTHLNHSLLNSEFSQNASLTSPSAVVQGQRLSSEDQNGEGLGSSEEVKNLENKSSNTPNAVTKCPNNKAEESDQNQPANDISKDTHSLINSSNTSKKPNSSHGISKSTKLKASGFKPIKPKPESDGAHNSIMSDLDNLNEECRGLQPLAPPCSIMCNGKKGMLPNLLCSRCLLLFHRECVPSGILFEDRRFICPNCIQPSDNDKQVNASMNGNSVVDSSNPLTSKLSGNKGSLNLNQSSSMVSVKSSRSYLPILPKPPSNHQMDSINNSTSHASHFSVHTQRSKQSQSQTQQSNSLMDESFHSSDHSHQSKKPSRQGTSHSAGMRLKLPAGTHLYRVSGSSNSIKPHTLNQSSLNHNSNHNLNRKSLKSQAHRSLIQPGKGSSSYPPSIASIKIPPNQMASFIQNKVSKPKPFLNIIKSDWSLLTNGYECLNAILKHLIVRDLIVLKQVSKTFNNLASHPFLWQKMKLKGLTINDWQHLGRNIIETFGTTEVDFDGIRFSGNDETWRNFASIIDYLKPIKHLRFGSVPLFVIEDIVNAAVDENCYNSFSSLETLEVKNLYEEDSSSKQCNLGFIEQIGCLGSLRNLKLDCKHGMFLRKESGHSLNSLSSLANLRCLILPNLKGFTVEQFEFLANLSLLKELEIGSCESWTTVEDKYEVREKERKDKQTNESEGKERLEDDEREEEGKEKVKDGQKEDEEVEEEREGDDEEEREEEEEEEEEEEKDKEEEKEDDENEEDGEMSKKSEQVDQLKGAFKYLSKLTELRKLKLCDVIIDETSNQLSLSIQKMKHLESLSLDCVTISPDATQTLSFLCTTIKNHLNHLKQFSISTDDPHTNKCVLDLLKNLNNLDHIIWKVGTLVEDSGECFVPFLKERGDESDIEEENLDLTSGEDNLEMTEVDYLQQYLQGHLSRTKVEILPQ